jgi:hypothetical protein
VLQSAQPDIDVVADDCVVDVQRAIVARLGEAVSLLLRRTISSSAVISASFSATAVSARTLRICSSIS